MFIKLIMQNPKIVLILLLGLSVSTTYLLIKPKVFHDSDIAMFDKYCADNNWHH